MALRFGEQDGGFSSGLLFGSQSEFTTDADITGSGAMQAQPATVVGTGIRGVVDLGSLPEFSAGVGTVVGVGKVIHVGVGALQAQSASASGVGAGAGTITGAGAVQAGSSIVAGSGIVGVGGTGVLQAREATVVGAGGLAGQVFGTGVLLSQPAVVTGVAEREVKGSGSAAAQSATLFGVGTTITIAVDYVCYLPPNTIEFEALPIKARYSLQFANPRNIPRSVTVNWDDLVTFHAGPKPQDEVAYRFSNDKEFLEDQDDYPHGDD